jgi:hypothetical protein
MYERGDHLLRTELIRLRFSVGLWKAMVESHVLLKLGFEVAQSSVAKYMVKRRGPPSLGWRTFLRNRAPDIAAMDLFVVPTPNRRQSARLRCARRVRDLRASCGTIFCQAALNA